jgi:hypothetical protein
VACWPSAYGIFTRRLYICNDSPRRTNSYVCLSLRGVHKRRFYSWSMTAVIEIKRDLHYVGAADIWKHVLDWGLSDISGILAHKKIPDIRRSGRFNLTSSVVSRFDFAYISSDQFVLILVRHFDILYDEFHKYFEMPSLAMHFVFMMRDLTWITFFLEKRKENVQHAHICLHGRYRCMKIIYKRHTKCDI